MQPLSHDQYLSLCKDAELLEADHYGEKVLKLRDGSYLKLFRRKRTLSSSIFRPYSVRFTLNAKELHARGIPCPKIIDIYRIPEIERTAVHYWPLEGQTLRKIFSQTGKERSEILCTALGAFIADLHNRGIYFRSLHLGNIILDSTGQLGLIDIADMRCSGKPLNTGKRERNFKHLFRYPEDISFLQPAAELLVTSYCEALPLIQSRALRRRLEKLLSFAKTGTMQKKSNPGRE